jgi:hypothetical protein
MHYASHKGKCKMHHSQIQSGNALFYSAFKFGCLDCLKANMGHQECLNFTPE